MDALIGYTGFVGSHLIREGMDFYNSKTIETMRGKTYNTVYCSGLYAEKWKANKDPATDRIRMESLMDVLRAVQCSRFVLISTVDVYDNRIPQCEEPDAYPNVYATHPYGAHRREMEEWAQKTFSDVYIFRLPALFGPGLKKNALYDLLHSNQIEKLRFHWVFQWYDVRWLAGDIAKHIAKQHHIVNLVTPSMSLGLVQSLFFPGISLSRKSDFPVNYQIDSRYGYSHTLEEVLMAIGAFVRSAPSRLLVSELAWSPDQSDLFRAFLRAHDLGEEIVPSKRNWDMREYSNSYSAQSILYGVDIQIFQEPERFLEILRDRLVRLASVGVKIVVFGSPRQRLYSGEDALGLFRRVGNLCQEFGITLCLENNAREYGANWLNTLRETVEFVETVNHPFVRVNLDTGSMILENETTVPQTRFISHVQVSFPKLGVWDPGSIYIVRAILAQIPDYSGKISLEMNVPSLTSIQAFVEELTPFQKSQ